MALELHRVRTCLVSIGLALTAARGAHAQLRREGIEFQVSTVTLTDQKEPAVAAGANGDFVVVWQTYGAGSDSDIFARRFSSSGVKLASEFQVNAETVSFQFTASAAAEHDGDFVVAWTSRYQDGSSNGIFARRFASSGAALGVEFQVNTTTTGDQKYPSVATSAAGELVVVWQVTGQDGGGYAAFGQRFSSAGARLGGEFQVNTYTESDQAAPAVAAAASGDFVVVWSSRQDGDGYGVFGRRFSSAGAALASEFQINEYTTSNQTQAAVAAAPDGAFVVAWRTYEQAVANVAIYGRRFSSSGAPVGGEFLALDGGKYPTVAIEGGGEALVSGHTENGDGSNDGVFARVYSSAGAPLGGGFQVNTYTTGAQFQPMAAADDDGDFVVVWVSDGQDGGSFGVFGQRLASLAVLDIDGNGVLNPLTDGVLVLRFLFTFTNTTLTSGAVGAGCTRCDASAIATYLTGLGPVLDVDGDSTKGALTDGLLVLRFLFGFTGSTLTTGDIGGGCSRCDATAIVPYLAGLS